MGISSLRAERSEGLGTNISSGASIVDIDLAVGSADSRVAVGMFEIVEIFPLGWWVCKSA